MTDAQCRSSGAEQTRRVGEGWLDYLPTRPNDPFVSVWEASLSPQIGPLVWARSDCTSLGVRNTTDDESDPSATVRAVSVTYRGRKNPEWNVIRRSIRAILVRGGWDQVDVEVRRGDFWGGGITRATEHFPTLPGDPFVDAWESSLYPQIIALVSPRTGWSCLGVRNIRWYDDAADSPPVRTVRVSICGPQARLHEWDELEHTIHTILAQGGWTGIEVEIIRGGASRAGFADEYVKDFACNVGVEAGAQHKKGVIGGWLALEFGAGGNKTVDIMGLTCHHVLLHAETPTGKSNTLIRGTNFVSILGQASIETEFPPIKDSSCLR